jgi:hypothetical protein
MLPATVPSSASVAAIESSANVTSRQSSPWNRRTECAAVGIRGGVGAPIHTGSKAHIAVAIFAELPIVHTPKAEPVLEIPFATLPVRFEYVDAVTTWFLYESAMSLALSAETCFKT